MRCRASIFRNEAKVSDYFVVPMHFPTNCPCALYSLWAPHALIIPNFLETSQVHENPGEPHMPWSSLVGPCRHLQAPPETPAGRANQRKEGQLRHQGSQQPPPLQLPMAIRTSHLHSQTSQATQRPSVQPLEQPSERGVASMVQPTAPMCSVHAPQQRSGTFRTWNVVQSAASVTSSPTFFNMFFNRFLLFLKLLTQKKSTPQCPDVCPPTAQSMAHQPKSSSPKFPSQRFRSSEQQGFLFFFERGPSRDRRGLAGRPNPTPCNPLPKDEPSPDKSCFCGVS